MRSLELLAPARDADVARQAILHGADAVYMGASSHGARRAAANSLDHIRQTVDFAHIYRAKVYVTVNTIVYENELRSVERLITDLYRAGVDAIIVQDMGILRLDIPPIALHASTQCDTRTLAKARFLQEVGFSQIVLARELTIAEISEIAHGLQVPVEVFIHGALCVSYSGRCHASQHLCGRSANRGECAQICRLPFDLVDARGERLAKGKHLLSLKDFNASTVLPQLIEAGASSFKIEGRLKDAAYVKNVTAYYSRLLDSFIERNPQQFTRSSFGRPQLRFEPDPGKSFNRSFTHYFLDERRPKAPISNPLTPKSMGEPIRQRTDLNRGDGISWIDRRTGRFTGALVNDILPDGALITSDGARIGSRVNIFRTSDLRFDRQLNGDTASRKIKVDISLDETGVSATDERGVSVRLPLDGIPAEQARSPQDHTVPFRKLGATNYTLRSVVSTIPTDRFIQISLLTELRRNLTAALDMANADTYQFDYRRSENADARFERTVLDYRDNVANSLAEAFYRSHGVVEIERALETQKQGAQKKEAQKQRRPAARKGAEATTDGRTMLMTARHCILRDMGRCLRTEAGKEIRSRLPLTLHNGATALTLQFDCDRCEMRVLS